MNFLMHGIKRSSLTLLMFLAIRLNVFADVTIQMSDGVRNSNTQSGNTLTQEQIQDLVNKGLGKLSKENPAAKDLLDSKQTIKIICMDDPKAKDLGINAGEAGLQQPDYAKTKGDFGADKKPKTGGTTYIAINCDFIAAHGWFKELDFFGAKQTMWNVLVHELLHATNQARTHGEGNDGNEIYETWVTNFNSGISGEIGKAKNKKKEPKKTVTVPDDSIAPEHSMFRTGEVQLLAFGIGGTGQGVRNVDVPGGGTVTRTTLVDIPGIPGLTPVTTTVPVMRSRNVAPIQGGFGGAGVEVKKFVTQNIGLGIEGTWIEGDSSIGTVMATVTARFPHGSNAPYLFVGGGVQFGDRTQGVGKIGGGIEHRFSPHSGIFADAAWMFSEHENAAVFRAGMSIAFGPGDPPLPPPAKYKK